MKFNVILLIIGLGGTVQSRVTAPLQARQEGDKVLLIRKEFQRINAARLTKKKVPYQCEGVPVDGSATFYSEKGKVVKIVVDYGFAGDYSSQSEFYYQQGKLIFSFNSATGGPASGKVTTTEQRLYVENDKTIKYMVNQKVLPCEVCSFNQSATEYKVLTAQNSAAVRRALCD